jgi:uncharacterized protein
MIIYILYIFSGLLAGLLSGLLGIGGGIVVVPALAYIFYNQGQIPAESVMQTAVGTSLAIMVLTSQVSVMAHNRQGRILWSIYKKMALGIAIGSVGGAILADYLHSDMLHLLFGIFLVIISFHMFFSWKPKHEKPLPNPIAMNVCSSGIGVLAALLGIGGGSLTTPFLNHYNVPARNIVAISAMGSLTVAVVGSVMNIFTGWNEPGFPQWSSGYIYWPAVLGVSIASVISTPLGAYLTYRLPVKTLKRIFSLCLLITGIKMLF